MQTRIERLEILAAWHKEQTQRALRARNHAKLPAQQEKHNMLAAHHIDTEKFLRDMVADLKAAAAVSFNGLRTELVKVTGCAPSIFVALPRESHRVINGGCGCDYCRSHPAKTPMWDTLVIDAAGKARTHVCHHPEFSQR